MHRAANLIGISLLAAAMIFHGSCHSIVGACGSVPVATCIPPRAEILSILLRLQCLHGRELERAPGDPMIRRWLSCTICGVAIQEQQWMEW